jgi:hypothetical protein
MLPVPETVYVNPRSYATTYARKTPYPLIIKHGKGKFPYLELIFPLKPACIRGFFPLPRLKTYQSARFLHEIPV